MGKKAGAFLTGAIIGGTDAFIKLKGQQMADDRQDARDKLLRDAVAGKGGAAAPSIDAAGTATGGSAPGFAGTREPAKIDEIKVPTPEPLNPIDQAQADHAAMADQFKAITATGG